MLNETRDELNERINRTVLNMVDIITKRIKNLNPEGEALIEIKDVDIWQELWQPESYSIADLLTKIQEWMTSWQQGGVLFDKGIGETELLGIDCSLAPTPDTKYMPSRHIPLRYTLYFSPMKYYEDGEGYERWANW